MPGKKYIRNPTESGDFYSATPELWEAYYQSVSSDWVLAEYLEEGNDPDFYYDPIVSNALEREEMKNTKTYIAAEPRMVERFVTGDGSEFDTREEALEYEFQSDLGREFDYARGGCLNLDESIAELGAELISFIRKNESMIRVALGDRDST